VVNETKQLIKTGIAKAIREQQIQSHESWYDSIVEQDSAFKRSALEDHIYDAEAKAKSSWITMGWALRKIRDEDLYKPDFATFAEYVEKQLGYKKSWAYEVIDASEIAKTVPITATAQARVLSGLEPEQQESVWQKAEDLALEEGKRGVTVATLKKAKGAMVTQSDTIPSETKKESGDKTVSNQDQLAEDIKSYRSALQQMALAIKTGIAESEGSHWFDEDQFIASMKNASRLLKLAAPKADCPYCKGTGCDSCLGLGWLPEGVYDSLPDDMKQPT
jgi:hypothetical protein